MVFIYSSITPAAQMSRKRYYLRAKSAKLALLWLLFSVNDSVTSCTVWRKPQPKCNLCLVIKGYLWWKRTLLPMATILALHHKYMKLVKQFTPHVIACSVRKGFRSVDLQNERAKSEIAVLSWHILMPNFWKLAFFWDGWHKYFWFGISAKFGLFFNNQFVCIDKTLNLDKNDQNGYFY